MSTHSAQILVSKNHFCNKQNQGCLEKWLIPGLGLENYKMIREHCAVPEKEIMRNNEDMSDVKKSA